MIKCNNTARKLTANCSQQSDNGMLAVFVRNLSIFCIHFMMGSHCSTQCYDWPFSWN